MLSVCYLVENWQTFMARPGLIRGEGIYPMLDGAALISKKLTESIR